MFYSYYLKERIFIVPELLNFNIRFSYLRFDESQESKCFISIPKLLNNTYAFQIDLILFPFNFEFTFFFYYFICKTLPVPDLVLANITH